MEHYIIPIVGMMIPIIIVPTALGFKHARFLRQVEHDERMRAMELGQTLAEDESWTPGNLAALIGAGVPVAALFVAFIAASKQGGSDMIWMAAGMIGVAGVICGSILAAQAMTKQAQARAQVSAHDQKPEFDPDAYDVVGRRG